MCKCMDIYHKMKVEVCMHSKLYRLVMRSYSYTRYNIFPSKEVASGHTGKTTYLPLGELFALV